MTARELTLDRLRAIMHASAGTDENVDLDGDIADVDFTELGYDSLAVLEMQSVIEQEFDLSLPDDATDAMTTPGATVAYVNRRLPQAA